MMEYKSEYYKLLQNKMDYFVHCVYALSRDFPKEELYGVTSQLRRASLSVVLNFIEGYARQRKAVFRNFIDISYGSLKESVYLLNFSQKEKYIINEELFNKTLQNADEIGAMLWKIRDNLINN